MQWINVFLLFIAHAKRSKRSTFACVCNWGVTKEREKSNKFEKTNVNFERKKVSFENLFYTSPFSILLDFSGVYCCLCLFLYFYFFPFSFWNFITKLVCLLGKACYWQICKLAIETICAHIFTYTHWPYRRHYLIYFWYHKNYVHCNIQ